MYMTKRVFKNKKLIRNILILAGLVIVVFFLWRAFFWTRLLEGNTEATQEDRNKASAICTAKGEENGSFDVEACFAEETINQTRIRLAAAVAQPTTQGPTQAVAQPTTQGPTQAVAQPTTQG
jgi:hypothetical protein